MKKLNYYQVHKNKNPKKLKPKKVCRSVRNIKFYYNVLDKMSDILNKICSDIEQNFQETISKMPKRGVSHLETLQKEGKIIISIDSGGGTI